MTTYKISNTSIECKPNQPLLSICIPTYNRSLYLENCLESIKSSISNRELNIEICISDNASLDDTLKIIKGTSIGVPLRYSINKKNLGMAQNFLNVVSMAKGEFIWLIGDDDLILPDGLDRILNIIKGNKQVDFFYVNAYHLDVKYLSDYPHPFNTKFLPKKMEKFSKISDSNELKFFELISPEISFDFLGGIFLSVFRREKWISSVHHLSQDALRSSITFSHFDNTFPHIKIWANAFSNSKAFINAEPMIVCISGVREWATMSPMIMSLRLPEALKIYRSSGMGWWRYMYCMNFSLRSFIPDLASMFLKRRNYHFKIPFMKMIINSIPYPNAYLSPIYYIIRAIKNYKLIK